MKKITLFAMILVAVLTLGFHNIGNGQVLLNENFDYTAGTPLTSYTWSQTGTTATFPIQVSAPGLIYAGYLSSGIGNAATLGTTGQDVNKPFAIQTSGTVYASFLVSVSSTQQPSGDYFFHFIQSPLGTTFKGRIFVKKDAASGNFAFGISKSSTSIINYTGFTYALNTTYLVVIKYQFNSGTTTDDNVSLYIDPAIGAPEPALPTIAYIDNTQTDATNLEFVALRQGSSTQAAALQIDGIRVGQSWTDLFPAPTPIPTLSQWGLIILGCVLLGAGTLFILRRNG